ncbi:MAG TPA: hypothetical protein P5120_11690 [Spirochaetota bacterium]|nr:hypothetical protein [Spirochaetota bacterium]HPF06835.1 hypothetical protein [Spirochaetota bacterium]HPJ43264.1 hypothetical protein [Spirochaetota bacterium]HPR38012.1 hypothetical protein [Spirochaetota bacterium]HRX48171.1 hypothetical protein [Spirochaetota bacterium]
MSTCKKTVIIITLTLLLFCTSAYSEDTGLKEVYTIQLSDTEGRKAWLPYIGEHPVVVVYEDFRNAGSTRELYLKSLEKPGFHNKIKLVYISNAAPAWYIPSPLINIYFRRRESQYKDIVFLIDSSRSLQTKWRIADTEGKTVIMLISRDGKIIDITYKIPGKSELEQFVENVEKLLDF